MFLERCKKRLLVASLNRVNFIDRGQLTLSKPICLIEIMSGMVGIHA